MLCKQVGILKKYYKITFSRLFLPFSLAEFWIFSQCGLQSFWTKARKREDYFGLVSPPPLFHEVPRAKSDFLIAVKSGQNEAVLKTVLKPGIGENLKK